MIQNEKRFDTLVAEALAYPFSGWDFSYLRGRWQDDNPPWHYEQIVRLHIKGAESLLDMGTGGGEFLASLAPLPKKTYATESWTPNISIATQRLKPLGVRVYDIPDSEPLPFADDSLDVVINRHDLYDLHEVFRVLEPEGIFITQQVGSMNAIELNRLILGDVFDNDSFTLDTEHQKFSDAGFIVKQAQEAFPSLIFFDVGAVVYYLKVIEWQIPTFDVKKHRRQLGEIHNHIEKTGKLTIPQHRFLFVCQKRA